MMDPVTLFMIIAIIAAIVLLEFYKQQESRIPNNLHNDNLKQFLTITALEYKLNDLKAKDENDRREITHQITQLVDGYDKGEIQADVFQRQMDFMTERVR